MYALVDGNNFYVSCERNFRPSLKTRPVVVLSNNDRLCHLPEQRGEGNRYPHGRPVVRVQATCGRTWGCGPVCELVLYGDMSNRMMGIAAGMGPGQEIYSIESFIDMAGVRGDLVKRGQDMRERILQWIGIPTGIGIGPTKTLAKLANHVAKSADRKPGSYPKEFARVCNLGALPAADLDAVLEATNVDEVWGIGRRIAKQLNDEGVMNVRQLVQIDPATIRRRWSVVLERTLRELQGQQCIRLEHEPPPKQEIAYTRSFGQPVRSMFELTQAVTEFASGAAAKLRLQNGKAGQINVFIHTSPFREGPQYSRNATVPLRRPTSDTLLLVNAAVRGLQAIYKPGFNFIKAGVMLLDLQDASVEQHELDLEEEPETRSALMGTLDKLNDRFGRGTVLMASAGLEGKERSWAMRQELLTPQYTTRWDELPVAVA